MFEDKELAKFGGSYYSYAKRNETKRAETTRKSRNDNRKLLTSPKRPKFSILGKSGTFY